MEKFIILEQDSNDISIFNKIKSTHSPIGFLQRGPLILNETTPAHTPIGWFQWRPGNLLD